MFSTVTSVQPVPSPTLSILVSPLSIVAAVAAQDDDYDADPRNDTMAVPCSLVPCFFCSDVNTAA